MNVGYFGGTFDPIHRGHLALARAAQAQYKLARVLFIPSGTPPHKQQPLASFVHRYAMVSLATASEKACCPSLLEAPTATSGKAGNAQPSYSIDTLLRMKKDLRKADRVFFLIGIDAFKDIAKWHRAESLFRECEFVVASRPGYSLADVANWLPEKLRPAAAVTKPFAKHAATGDLILSGVVVHLLDGVHEGVSATAVRQALHRKRALGKLLDPAVEAYIKKTGLYAGPIPPKD
jgi:nicotinate-nucleotide adenylyltransferase